MQPLNEPTTDDKQHLDTLLMTIAPANPLDKALLMAYALGRATGRLEGLDRAKEVAFGGSHG